MGVEDLLDLYQHAAAAANDDGEPPWWWRGGGGTVTITGTATCWDRTI